MSTSATIRPDSRIRRRQEAKAQNLDAALLMRNSATGEFYGLESIALRIWELLEQPRTVQTLCAELRNEYDVDPATCQGDVLEFLADLGREGLIEIEDCTA